jgi:hypothetical protein
MIETGRVLLLRKDEPINKPKMKMGAVSAQHIVGGHKYSFKRQEIS